MYLCLNSTSTSNKTLWISFPSIKLLTPVALSVCIIRSDLLLLSILEGYHNASHHLSGKISSGARRAHYAIFIPTGDAGEVGKLLHVTGNPATGYLLEFRRKYDFRGTYRKHHVEPLGQVFGRFITDTPGNGQASSDRTAQDDLESIALTVYPPGPRADPFDPLVCNSPIDISIISNLLFWQAPRSQDWIRDYVTRLVRDGIIAQSAISVVQNAPEILWICFRRETWMRLWNEVVINLIQSSINLTQPSYVRSGSKVSPSSFLP